MPLFSAGGIPYTVTQFFLDEVWSGRTGEGRKMEGEICEHRLNKSTTRLKDDNNILNVILSSQQCHKKPQGPAAINHWE